MVEELEKSLAERFTVAVSQVSTFNNNGYRLMLKSPWNLSGCHVDHVRVQLCGIDPLTGADVKQDDIFARFAPDCQQHQTEILTYHGEFYLSCTAVMKDGREQHLYDQEVSLNFEKNLPYIKLKTVPGHKFQYVELEANCWKSCRGKVWLYFDGQYQRVDLAAGSDRKVRLHIPTDGPVEVFAQDKSIRIDKKRTVV